MFPKGEGLMRGKGSARISRELLLGLISLPPEQIKIQPYSPMIVRMMNTCGQHLSSCRFHSNNRPYEVNREMVTRSAIRTTVAPAILASFTPVLWSRQHNATGNKRARNLILPWPQIPSRRGTRWMSSPLRRSNLLAISKLQTTVPEF